MAKYTKVDSDLCIACGACCTAAPEIFAEDGDGMAYSVLDDNLGTTAIDDNLLDALSEAEDCCPVEAILVSDSEFE